MFNKLKLILNMTIICIMSVSCNKCHQDREDKRSLMLIILKILFNS